MKIGIITYHFYPSLNARAFRAFELAKGFSVKGHDVTVFTAGVGEAAPFHDFKTVYIAPGFLLNARQKLEAYERSKKESPVIAPAAGAAPAPGLLSRGKQKLINAAYPGGISFEFALCARKYFRKHRHSFDLLITIGLPVASHFAGYFAMKTIRGFTKVAVADYGDPYFFNHVIRPPFFHKYLERKMLSRYDFITVPIEAAKPCYEHYKPAEKIIVIPQGIDFASVKRSEYVPNAIPTFIYAGNFYLGLRDPHELFDCLLKIDRPFRFILYTDMNDSSNAEIINRYAAKMKGKLEVHKMISREKCIWEMSRADFLLNIFNTSTTQNPSKIIDYCLSGRPVYSYSPGKFDKERFLDFIDGNYESDLCASVNMEQYKIENVVDRFLELTDMGTI